MNYLRLTDKGDFRKKIFKKPLAAIPILLLCFHFFLYCTNGHCLSKSSLQLMLLSVFTSCNSENKRTYSAQVRLHCVLLKKIISV